MRKIIISTVLMIILSGLVHHAGGDDRGEIPPVDTRSVSFIDIGESHFDQTDAPTFISAVDWNSDGYDDLLFNGHRLMKNNGPPDFDFTYMSSVFDGSVSGASNGAWADWDGDGDQDLYQGCSKGTADRFWENQGAPDFIMKDISSTVFEEFYSNVGPCTGASWGDYDRDGDLDLYIGNGEDWNDGNPVYYRDSMLRNDEGSKLTDISHMVGIRTGEDFYSRGATWGDHDNDRWSDIYVSHYRIRENHLMVNQKNGFFQEMGTEKNCSGTYNTTWYRDSEASRIYGQLMWGPTWGHTIGSSWADFNRDGNLDLWTSDFVHKYVGYIGSWYDIRGYVCDDANLYINDGAPLYTFTDHRNISGIPIWPTGGSGIYRGDQTFSGVSIGDMDNDGWEDIYIPQVYGNLPYTTPYLFRNRGIVQDGSALNGTTFEDITDQMGIEGANTYACLFFDRDNDGDLDIVTGGADTWDGSDWSDYRVRLFDNQGTGDNRYLRIKLNGSGMNPDAVGARVNIRIENQMGHREMLTREVRAGTGHAHQQSNVLHFGLGSDLDPENMDLFSVEVIWPNGNIQWVRVKEADTTIFIDQPTPEKFPLVNSVTVSPLKINEDEEVTVTVNATPGSSPILFYLWDLDLDNHFDSMTSSNSISFIPEGDGTRQIRCQVVAGSDPGNTRFIAETLPVDIKVKNVIPKVDLHSIYGYMDSAVHPGSDLIYDTKSDLRNITWNISWGDGKFDDGVGNQIPDHIYTYPGEFELVVTVKDEEFTVIENGFARISNVDPWGWIEVQPETNGTYTEDVWIEFIPHVFDTVSDDRDPQLIWSVPQGSYFEGEIGRSLFLKFDDPGKETIELEVTDQFEGSTSLIKEIEIINYPPGLKLVDERSNQIGAEEDEEILFDMVEGLDNRSDMDDGLYYHWTSGDGHYRSWSKSAIYYHTYEHAGNYTAVCTVRDNNGDTDTFEIQVNIENVAPTLSDLEIGYQYFEDEVIRIEDYDIFDTPSDIDGIEINIETDGPSAIWFESGVPCVRFFQSGSYDIIMTVTDDDGESSSLTKSVEVLNQAPQGFIRKRTHSIAEDHPFYLEAIDILDTESDLANLTIEWDIEDENERISGALVTHRFSTSGSKKVVLIISDGDSTIFKEEFIRVNNPEPVASFTLEREDETIYVGENIILDASGSDDNPSDRKTLNYFWDMDDGNFLPGKIINYTYYAPGTYMIELTVTDNDGDYDMAFLEIEILPLEGLNGKKGSKNVGSFIIFMVISITILIVIFAVAIMVATIVSRRKARTAEDRKVSSSEVKNRKITLEKVRTPDDDLSAGRSDL